MMQGFEIGFAEDRNRRYRRTMEDAHSFFYKFGDIEKQGWFAIFDGHAGKTAAEWCGNNLHLNFETLLTNHKDTPVPELLNKTFQSTDTLLAEKRVHAGCTAVVAFMRTEVRNLRQRLNNPYSAEEEGQVFASSNEQTSASINDVAAAAGDVKPPAATEVELKEGEDDDSHTQECRVLYTANVGDARAVLCRKGEAVRLSYDHKGSDPFEAHRIAECGGFVYNNRVNGVLAVTRSLGDISMKDWVIGKPYTTESILNEDDSLLILACDGLWDVCSDQTAVDLIKDTLDPQQAADQLLEFAINKCSTDNLSIIVVRLHH